MLQEPGTPISDWRDWWDSAEDQYSVAEELQHGGRASYFVFQALMAFEMCAKAVRLRDASWADLKELSWAEIGNATWSNFAGRAPARGRSGHQASAQFDLPWHPQRSAEGAEQQIEVVETCLGLKRGALYMASRYPDGGWKDNRGAPHRLIQDDDARLVLEAVGIFLQDCRNHIRGGLDSGTQ